MRDFLFPTWEKLKQIFSKPRQEKGVYRINFHFYENDIVTINDLKEVLKILVTYDTFDGILNTHFILTKAESIEIDLLNSNQSLNLEVWTLEMWAFPRDLDLILSSILNTCKLNALTYYKVADKIELITEMNY